MQASSFIYMHINRIQAQKYIRLSFKSFEYLRSKSLNEVGVGGDQHNSNPKEKKSQTLDFAK